MSWRKFLVCFIICGVIGYHAVEPFFPGSGYLGGLIFAQIAVTAFFILRGGEGQEG